MTRRTAPDGGALVAAKRVGGATFTKALARERKAGFSDGEIVKAMASATEMINAIGSLSLMPVPRVKHPKEPKHRRARP